MEAVEIADPASLRSAVVQALEAVLARRARTLLLADRDFAGWPLDDAAFLDRLTQWLRLPGRRLTMLAERFDRVEALHPRFVRWRTTWSHAVDARRHDAPEDETLPTLLLDDGPTVLSVWNVDPLRGRLQRDARAAASARDDIDACLQRSAPDWPVRTLGL